MGIPNVSTLIERIKKGSEGGNEFSRLMNLILISEFNELNEKFNPFSDANGDYKGVDSFVKSKVYVTGFQYKFYPSPLSTNHKSLIKKSLKDALRKFQDLSTWIIVTPDDFMRNDVEWFEKLKEEFEFDLPMHEAFLLNRNGAPFKRTMFKIEHWGHTKIMELILKHPHIGEKYYPELFLSREKQDFKLVKLGVDFNNCNWARSRNYDLSFMQYSLDTKKHKTSDIIFDCFFINNSRSIYLLHSIDVKIIDYWVELKGIASDKLLNSIGEISIEVDFDKEITRYNFESPVIFNEKSPQRFSIQMLSLTQNCPGNTVKLKLSFNFSEHSIETEVIYLSFV